MAVAPALPWRATTGEVLRRPPAHPRMGGRSDHGRRGRARRPRARPGADVRPGRVRASPASSASSGSRSRAHGPVPGGAGQPPPLRRADRAHRHRDHRGRDRVVVGVHDPARKSASSGASRRRSRLHGHLRRLRRSSAPTRRTTVHARVAHRAGRRRSRRLRARDLDLPELAARDRHAVGAHRVCGRTSTSRSSRRPTSAGGSRSGSRSTR